MFLRCLFAIFLASYSLSIFADVVLIGDNPPHQNVNDGDFNLIPGWQIHQSPFWKVNKRLS